jgi:hypothetical protein
MPLNNSFDAITVAFGVETLKLSKSLLKYWEFEPNGFCNS